MLINFNLLLIESDWLNQIYFSSEIIAQRAHVNNVQVAQKSSEWVIATFSYHDIAFQVSVFAFKY